MEKETREALTTHLAFTTNIKIIQRYKFQLILFLCIAEKSMKLDNIIIYYYRKKKRQKE